MDLKVTSISTEEYTPDDRKRDADQYIQFPVQGCAGKASGKCRSTKNQE